MTRLEILREYGYGKSDFTIVQLLKAIGKFKWRYKN